MNNIEKLNSILDAFKVAAICRDFHEYKNACSYDIELKPGTRLKDLEKYSTEFSLALRTYSKPRINVLPESGVVRFEFLKSKGEKITLCELGQTAIRPSGELTCLLGETLEGTPLWVDLAKNPHMLVAGCTGSGKSTTLHTIIANMLLYPKVQVFLMDPKRIEFFLYDDEKIKNTQVVYDFDQCVAMLEFLNEEMDQRYAQIKERKVDVTNFPYLVLIIDEFADLRLQDHSNVFHKLLCRLAQKSRAARIHIILATQRPSVNVVDGMIKANFPARLSCKVASHIDSRVILDATGAEDLVGLGDSIINNNEHTLQRFQAAFTDAAEVCKLFGIHDSPTN